VAIEAGPTSSTGIGKLCEADINIRSGEAG
jgi:hypothetical protein